MQLTEYFALLYRQLSALRSQLTEVEEKLRRIYKMVEDGVAEIDDILKSRINELKDERDRTRTAPERIDQSIAGRQDITAEAIGRFATAMRHNIVNGDIPFRKAYIQSVVDRIEVDNHLIRIIGDKSTLEYAVSGAVSTSAGVRRSVPKWRTLRNKTANIYLIEIMI
jgi:hypothetical protein